ncbi:hypothetical protein ACFQDE_17860 [Deinococcus caeni]
MIEIDPIAGLAVRARAACLDLARLTEVPGEITRTFLSPPRGT